MDFSISCITLFIRRLIMKTKKYLKDAGLQNKIQTGASPQQCISPCEKLCGDTCAAYCDASWILSCGFNAQTTINWSVGWSV